MSITSQPSPPAHGISPYAPVIIKLLQGVIDSDDRHWEMLLSHRTTVTDHFSRLGIEVVVDESEGYAFLRQAQDEEDRPADLPRLFRRVKLSYDVTLLCVLLRERLAHFDAHNTDSARLVLSHEELYEMTRAFFRERANEVRTVRQFDAVVNRGVDLGFLRKLDGAGEPRYEVKRIIKARVSADVLAEIKQKLEERAAADA